MSIALLALVYLLGAKFGLQLALVNPYATAVWAPTWHRAHCLAVARIPALAGVMIGAFLANVTTGDITLNGVLVSLGIATGNTLEALLGAYLVNRFAGGQQAFHRVRDVFRGRAPCRSAVTTINQNRGWCQVV